MNYGRKNTSWRRRALQARSNKKKQKLVLRPSKMWLPVLLGIGILGLVGGGLLFMKIIGDTPKITADDLKPSAYTTTAYASDGETVIGTFVNAGANRVFTSLDNIPKYLQDAFIAVEDSRFREHKGVDYKGIMRAAWTGIKSGNFSQGGSTITQQLIKNRVFPQFSLESGFQKVERKIQELYLAIQVEKIIDKDEILENYLNTINLGQNTLGVQSASKRYFNKDVKDLTLSEAVTIAAITKSPSGYNPITNPEANQKRREKVLGDMLKQGFINQEEHDTALADNVYERIQAANATYQENLTVNSYFVDEVAKEVINDLCNILGYTKEQAQNAVYSGGLKIMTTQDVTMQKICEEEMNRAENYPSKVEWTVSGAISIVHQDGTQKHYDHNSFGNYVKEYNANEYGPYGTTFPSKEKANALLEEYISTLKSSENDTVYTNIILSPQPQASLVIMDQKTGHVKAMVGGRGEKTSNMTLNRATQSGRQPGSCFKVLSTFVPALDAKGNTLATQILDSPFNYSDPERTPVNNWWGGYRGNMSIRKCIQESANVCTVKKYTEITPTLGFQYLTENFGFTTLDSSRDMGQAVCLGGITNGVYNIELTAAYASIANGGTYTEPILYTRLYDHDGNLLYEKTPKTHTAMKASTAALITSAMEDVMKYGTGRMGRLSGMVCAGKTGTTTDTRDLWYSGYTPYLTGSIWSGYDDNQEMDGNESYHLVIWRKVMERINSAMAYKSVKFEMPEDVVRRSLCSETGKLATDSCATKYTEYYAKDTLPKQTCPGHAGVPADGTTEGAATP